MRLAKGLLVSVAATVATLCCAATVSAATNPAPIGPNQHFAGLVNGTHNNAVIYMICPGPVHPGQFGHPEAGQSVSVTQSAAVTNGFTGSLANSIVVTFSVPVTNTAITLKFYDTPASIPTTFLLPCSGTGQVRYTPAPTSSTARADVVGVTFINLAVAPS